jgi:hypothetical protein
MRTKPSQRRAIRSYRARLHQRGLARFELVARRGDRALLRSVAQTLVDGGDEATRLRATLRETLSPAPPGGILAALRRSPLVGVDLDIRRDKTPGRDTKL